MRGENERKERKRRRRRVSHVDAEQSDECEGH